MARQVSAVDSIDLVLTARMLLFATAVPAMALLPLPTLTALLTLVRVRAGARGPDSETLQRHAELACRLVRRLTRRPCLVRSLVLYYFLRRSGVDVAITFGIGRPREALVGHCWITRDGTPFCEQRDPRAVYAAFYRIPR